MPESMFGRPSQDLLPYPQSSADDAGQSDPRPAPVPPQFKDFRFNSIGKQPDLLSRISLSLPDHSEYHSPTPSPTSTPPPDSYPMSSKPTLFQQLAGSDFVAMGGAWNASTSQPNGSLASRIQMEDNPSNDITNARGTSSKFPSPSLRVSIAGRATKDASLIPPVEVLPQPPDSAPPIPASWVPALEPPPSVYSPAASTPLINTTTIPTSRIPTPIVTKSTASKEPMAVTDTSMQGLQPSPSTTAATDSLTARQDHLQSIRARLAELALPLPPQISQSPPLDPSSVTSPSANLISNPPSIQSRHTSPPVVLYHPYSADQSSNQLALGINNTQMHMNDLSLTIVSSNNPLTQEYQIQRGAIDTAVRNFTSALEASHSAQIDKEHALALRTRAFEEQCAAFEQTKRAEEATLQQGFQELERKREELNAKEASLENENRAREEARKGVLAKWQAQEEEKRATEAKRVQDIEEQITAAIKEVKEIAALREKYRVEQLADVTLSDDLPTEAEEGMDEKERNAIKTRNEIFCALKQLRRMHTEKVQKLEETNHTLRTLGERRKKRAAEEAERRRLAEEERLRAHAEMERARQLQDDSRRELEAQRKRQEVENGREHARLLAEQQAHAEAQVHGFGRMEATNEQTIEYSSRSEEIGAPRQQEVANPARIRATREENPLFKETSTAMNVDEDGRAITLHRTPPSSDVHKSLGVSQSKQKKDKAISGGVMLAPPTSKASSGHLPSKPLATASLSSPDRAARNPPNPARTSPTVPVSLDGSRRSSFLPQSVSVSNGPDIPQTSDYKPPFSRTPKSQTILEPTNGGNQELDIGPVPGVSPAQQNVNLRHLKRFRGRVEGNDSVDRSVRTIQVKSEENPHPSFKREEHDDRPCEVVQASPPTHPAIIPPPRPRMFRKHLEAPTSQTDPSSSYPPEGGEPPFTRRETEVEQPRETLAQDAPRSQAMNAPVRFAPVETGNSLVSDGVSQVPQTAETRNDANDRIIQGCDENYDTTPPEPANANFFRDLDGGDPSRSNKRFSDEQHMGRNVNGSRRVSDHYSPPQSSATSPTQPHRPPTDTWRPQNATNGTRAEPMRATSPISGRKRPSEFGNSEHVHRARRQRGDVWIAPDHDHDRVDSYRPHWDRRPDTEVDERRAAYRAPISLDRNRAYSPDVPRATYDNRTYTSEESTVPTTRWEPSYRRTENADVHQRYQPSVPAYNAMMDDRHVDDGRVDQTYEPMLEERLYAQPDPSLLARMQDTQRFPIRGRGRGEPRGRGDYPGRGRGRGVARGGTPLIERLTSVPSSLEHRLT